MRQLLSGKILAIGRSRLIICLYYLSLALRFSGTLDVDDLAIDLSRENRVSIIDAEIAGFLELNRRLIVEQGLGDSANVAIVAFDGDAVPLDLNPAVDGIQLTTTPNADNNDNGILDIQDAFSFDVDSIFGSTDFEAALQEGINVFSSLGTEPGNGNLIFISDGQDQGDFDDEIQALNDLDVNVSAFGAGSRVLMNQICDR